MRSTKVKVLAVTAAVTVMFTGCMTENANVKINSDGTASAVATVDIDKASMDTWLTSAGMTTSDISDGKEMKVVTKDGKEFYEATETYSSTVDKIGEVVKEALSSDAYVTSTTLYSEVSLAQSESVAMYSAMESTHQRLHLTLALSSLQQLHQQQEQLILLTQTKLILLLT